MYASQNSGGGSASTCTTGLAPGRVRMVVTLSQMHDAATTGMQREGFLSQISKLDKRYNWQAV